MAQPWAGGGQEGLAAIGGRDISLKSRGFEILLKESGDQTPNSSELGVVSPDSGFLKGDGQSHQLRMERGQMGTCPR